MMENLFKEYPDIENSYRSKHIGKFLNIYPELETTRYVIQEKLHGCNIQLIFRKHQEMQVCSRKRILSVGESFNNIWTVLKEYEAELSILNSYAQNYTSLTLYGELFGPGINKGIDYGDKKQIRFFDLAIDTFLSPPDVLYTILNNLKLDYLLVPILGEVDGLQEALDFYCDRPTTINPIPMNTCEGIVIKPYYKTYYNQEELFYLKKKNEKFLEKERDPKPIRELDEFDSLNEIFKTYITKNRLESVFSKEGEIEEDSKIGKYIKLMLDDAKEDFLKDHSIENTNKAQQKRIFNVGNIIANMLKEYL